MSFTIYPAIDLRNGRVVRLQYGDPDRQTTFSDDPAAVAQQWAAAGTSWLHIVNLDGAFDEKGAANWQALPAICAVGVPVQFGGGMRTIADIDRACAAGVHRVILGTAAIENPDLVAQAIAKYGADRVAVGIDARDGRVRTRGWQQETAATPAELGRQMKDRGVQTVIFTDISRDGVLSGVNVAATADLARSTGLQVIASGGVAGITDVEACAAEREAGITGVIIGRALYDARIRLEDALTYQ